jgi:hypothetical protein
VPPPRKGGAFARSHSRTFAHPAGKEGLPGARTRRKTWKASGETRRDLSVSASLAC